MFPCKRSPIIQFWLSLISVDLVRPLKVFRQLVGFLSKAGTATYENMLYTATSIATPHIKAKIMNRTFSELKIVTPILFNAMLSLSRGGMPPRLLGLLMGLLVD